MVLAMFYKWNCQRLRHPWPYKRVHFLYFAYKRHLFDNKCLTKGSFLAENSGFTHEKCTCVNIFSTLLNHTVWSIFAHFFSDLPYKRVTEFRRWCALWKSGVWKLEMAHRYTKVEEEPTPYPLGPVTILSDKCFVNHLRKADYFHISQWGSEITSRHLFRTSQHLNTCNSHYRKFIE